MADDIVRLPKEYKPKEAKLYTIALTVDENGNFFIDKSDIALNTLKEIAKGDAILPIPEIIESYEILNRHFVEIEKELVDMFNRKSAKG